MLGARRGTRFRFSSPFSSFLFEAKRGQSQKFGDGRDIPVGVSDVDVTEIRAQFRQVLFDVDTGAIPPDERLDGEAVPEVMEPRSIALLWASQAYLPR
jgi:hypothetical protein